MAKFPYVGKSSKHLKESRLSMDVNNLYEETCIDVAEEKITGPVPAFDNTRIAKILSSPGSSTIVLKGRMCSTCRSTETITTKKQTRSADEPETEINFCTKCSARF